MNPQAHYQPNITAIDDDDDDDTFYLWFYIISG
jgi:hypothetical protein